MSLNDPIGQAISDYNQKRKPADIIVSSDLCDDDIIPVETLFRTYDEMPEIEQKAISLAKGKILDVGAGAGPHSIILKEKGMQVTAIDSSLGAVDFMKSIGLNAIKSDFFNFSDGTFDTILLLMNGIGIAGTLENLGPALLHAKSLLSSGGQILCDSSDVSYLYEDEDGSYWTDLNNAYYGNFKFQLHYKKHNSDPFEWLYVDYESLHKTAALCGFTCKRIIESENHYLAQLTLN